MIDYSKFICFTKKRIKTIVFQTSAYSLEFAVILYLLWGVIPVQFILFGSVAAGMFLNSKKQWPIDDLDLINNAKWRLHNTQIAGTFLFLYELSLFITSAIL